MHYLRLNLHVRGAGMQQSPSVITPAPVLACVLFAHALDKKLDDALDVQGVGIVHHSAQPWLEHIDAKGFVQSSVIDRRGATLFEPGKVKQGVMTHSAQTQPMTSLHYTLVLEVRYELPLKQVRQRVQAMRLAGGTIEQAHARFFDDLPSALRSISKGFWVQDATREVWGALEPDADLLSSCLQQLARRDLGWLAPVNLGYSLLGPAQPREGARDGAPHAFAEHLLGVVRFVPLRKLAALRPPTADAQDAEDADNDCADELAQVLDRLEAASAPNTAEMTELHESTVLEGAAQRLPLWTYGWVGDEFVTTNDPALQELLVSSPR